MIDLVTSFHACYGDLVRHLTRKVGCHATAEDLVQDLYLKIAGTNLWFNGASPRGFIFTAATNLARDLWRRERRASRAEDVELLVAANITSEAPSAERVVAAKQQLRKMALALAELSPKCRDAFVQSRIHGLTHAEIAVKMGLSERMVAKYIVKALDHCRRRMDED
ncbi:MAG: RNA polymerase sigma factor [Nitrospira sp.]